MKWLSPRRAFPENSIKKGLRLRLRKTSESEILRWVDNAHTGLGKNIQELRKSLTHENTDQALVYIEDIRTGALALLASMDAIQEKRDTSYSIEI